MATYGNKPVKLQLEVSGEQFYIATEVANYLQLFRGKLFQKYRKLQKRCLADDEREQLLAKFGNPSLLASPSYLLLATEVEEIFAGNGDRYCSTKQTCEFDVAPKQPLQQEPLQPHQEPHSQEKNKRHKISKTTKVPVHLVSDKVMRTYPDCYEHSVKNLNSQAELTECLVPIRLDIEIDGKRLCDTFTWNKNEALLTPHTFAKILCDDLKLNPVQFLVPIEQQMQQQIRAFSDESTQNSKKIELKIKFNIKCKGKTFKENIRWSLLSDDLLPEEYAKQRCAELGLDSEFVPKIAFAIREQLMWHERKNAQKQNEEKANVN